jgi:hypothetical protein
MDIMETIEEILDRENVLYCETPTFLYDTSKRRIVTAEENTSSVRFIQMSIHAFNTAEELDRLIGRTDTIVVQINSLRQSPWEFCKYVIRFAIIKELI